MASQDLNIYFLYLLLLVSSVEVVNCDNFLVYYGFFAFCSTFVCAIFYPVSGWLTDWSGNNSPKLFMVTNFLQLILIVAQVVPHFVPWLANRGWIVLYVLWQMCQIVSIQNNNSLWKIVKQYCDLQGGGLVLVNKIGNVGDLTSDVMESALLGILIVVIMFVKNEIVNFYFVVVYLFGVLMVLNISLCVISFLLIRNGSLGNGGFMTPLASGNDMIVSSDVEDQAIKDKSKSKVRECLGWVKSSWLEFYNQKLLFHAFWHCILMTIFITIVQYPLSLKEVGIVSQSSEKTIDNYCGGVIINLIFLGAVTNGCYLVGSIAYRIFVVKIRPVVFYKYWYPIGLGILLCLTTCLWFDFNRILTYVFISISLIIPYYLTYYDYYLFTEQSKGDGYGFVLGLYGLVNTFVTLGIQGLYLAKMSFIVLLVINGVLLILGIVYSIYIVKVIRRDVYGDSMMDIN